MSGFHISTHGRLHDWTAVEKEYFEDEGLDYELDVNAQENAAQDVPADQPATCASAPTSSTARAAVARST